MDAYHFEDEMPPLPESAWDRLLLQRSDLRKVAAMLRENQWKKLAALDAAGKAERTIRDARKNATTSR